MTPEESVKTPAPRAPRKKKHVVTHKHLVIVESPAKAKTINKYLGKDYLVLSSKGHLFDLPKSRLAIDIEHDFKPEYKVVHGRSKDMKFLRDRAKESGQILLAADPDREGEAISWHLYNAFKPLNANIHRIVFNEITSEVIKEAIKHPADINVALVNAQQARRIMDRLVGYHLSPLLWKKVKAGLSAGRVQSVAMRIICEREDEIDKFLPEEYWEIPVELAKGSQVFPARLTRFKDVKIERVPSKEESDRIIADLRQSAFAVREVNEKTIRRKPLAPYTTSKLQQDAVNRLGFTAKKTMQIAQMLYEGVEIKGEGSTGLITYMRTDSTRVSAQALAMVRDFIGLHYGKDYLPEAPNAFEKGRDSQDAHEAVRPTSAERTPESVKESLDRPSYMLYKLIWERFVASQMTEAVFRSIQVSVTAGDYGLLVSGSQLIFAGFNKVFRAEQQQEVLKGIEDLRQGDVLTLHKIEGEQKFTMPPPRYTDATLVKVLEESGIGRPSTYAPTISTLLSRYYVTRNGRPLVPTPLGRKVNELLVNNFPDILNPNFTATMEKELDEIAEERKLWVDAVRDFYVPFAKDLADAHKNIEKLDLKLDQKTDFVCEKCGKPMLKKFGRYGYFLACSGFPQCRNIKPLPLGKCPRKDCGGTIVRRKGRRNRFFFGCLEYPKCEFTTYNDVLEQACPQCGKILVSVKEKGKAYKQCLNEECKFREELML
jgi:DNA topoisomerase-1